MEMLYSLWPKKKKKENVVCYSSIEGNSRLRRDWVLIDFHEDSACCGKCRGGCLVLMVEGQHEISHPNSPAECSVGQSSCVTIAPLLDM